MYLLIVALLIVICVFLVLVVLVQNPKGGGMGAGFGGAASSASGGGGVQRTTDFLEKATWGLAVAFFTLSLLSNVFLGSGSNDGPSTDDIDNVLEE